MIMRRVLRLAAGVLLVTSAASAGEPPLPRGFAFVSPELASSLSTSPTTPTRAAALRAADRVLSRVPKAMARVHVEGTLPGQGIYDASLEALKDLPAARDLALAARLTGEARYDDAAARLIRAWVETYKVSFNPIDETAFHQLFVAWDLLAESHRAGMAEAYGRMLHAFSRGYLDNPRRGATATNNWNSHRVMLIALAAFALGEPGLVEQARAAYAAQLRANIRADGSTIDFEARDAIRYVVFDLEPLATVELAARQHGQDWRGDADGALIRAIAWLSPYAAGARTHLEFEKTTIAFDLTRRDAGVPGFGGPFDPKKARTAMALAARLDERFIPVARALRSEPWQDRWLEVLLPLK